MQLNKFQDRFKETMLQPVSGLDDVDEELREVFVDNDISVEDRLKVYHNNIIGSVSASLCATFPTIETLVGEDFLKSMARAFVFENPPQSGCLHSYGTGFDNFIRTYTPAASLPYLADVATLELAINSAYYAANDQTMEPDALTHISEDRIGEVRLSLRASGVLVASEYPLLEIKNFCDNDAQGDAPDISNAAKTLLMVYRPALDVDIVSLEQDEFSFLTMLHNGLPLGEALEATLTAYPEFNFTFFLEKHISFETFSTL